MAHGERSSNLSNSNRDWWGKRPYSGRSVSRGSGVDKFFKRQVHKIERAEAKKEIIKQLTNW